MENNALLNKRLVKNNGLASKAHNGTDKHAASPEELKQKILQLKKEKNATILAHYYQEQGIQDVADFVGDSLALAYKARELEQELVLVAGVYFMGETVKIINNDKKVLVPDPEAGCSLADDCTAEKYNEFISRYPDHTKVTYVNCSAEVKASSDIVCTSSNAVKIVSAAAERGPVLFAPDKNLGRYVASATGIDMTLWDGSCIVHEQFSEQKILALKEANPGSKIIAHPECAELVILSADFIGSTKQLLEYAAQDTAETFIVVTEEGILYQMRKMLPAKKFIPAPLYEENTCNCGACPFMKMNSLEKVLDTLQQEHNEVKISEPVLFLARKPVEEMFRIMER